MPEALPAGPELVIGLVGAVGTDLDRVEQLLTEALADVRYTAHPIRLSNILKEIERTEPLKEFPLDARYNDYMDAGNELRKATKRGDAVALLGMEEIREYRRTSDRGTHNASEPVPRTGYILRSLKHPEEVLALKQVYGPGFLMVGAYSPKERRQRDLERKIAASYQEEISEQHTRAAEDLIRRDEKERAEKLGQNVRDTFPLSDVFLDASRGEDEVRVAISRFVAGLFKYQFHTPSREEYAMFHAKAAALRSGEMGRQVGAAITTEEGEIVAVGTNEVPAGGGGQYWPPRGHDEVDARDFLNDEDGSDRRKRTSLVEVLTQLKSGGWFKPEYDGLNPTELLEKSLPLMESTRLMNLIEFGRAVHAEMAAISDAVRRGVAVQACTLYTTTFPCHNCTRHIISAGIKRLVYIEPYAKSLASDLHDDAIALDAGRSAGDKRVQFEPFVGIAPQFYMQFFTMGIRKKPDGKKVEWKTESGLPRVFPPHMNYFQNEAEEASKFAGLLAASGITLK